MYFLAFWAFKGQAQCSKSSIYSKKTSPNQKISIETLTEKNLYDDFMDFED